MRALRSAHRAVLTAAMNAKNPPCIFRHSMQNERMTGWVASSDT
jgi:hypothetical protein